MPGQKVAILGCSGMLGSIVLDYFANKTKYQAIATLSNDKDLRSWQKKYADVEFRVFDAEGDFAQVKGAIKDADWAINAIGIIKPYIHDDNAKEIERAVKVNALFPHLLGRAAQETGAKVVQIATDCVFSGEKGSYIETDQHDALDVYGKTKSIGEAYFDNVYHLRCSIIGPEIKAHLSLMDWFLGQPVGTDVNGFRNHYWNGVTTLSYARLCAGIIKDDIEINHLQHIVPSGRISKADMLNVFSLEFGRKDIKITPTDAPKIVDRTLETTNKELNASIWKATGYQKIPTVEEMIKELANYSLPERKK